MSPTIGRRTLTRAGLAVLAGLALAAAPAASMVTSSATADGERSAASAGTDPLAAVPVKRACPGPVRPGQVTCLALVRTDVTSQYGIQPQGRPAGLGATDIRDAYRLPTASAGAGQTVAIINVFDDPKAEADLAVYRAQYGLPPCTTASGCLKKINSKGGTTLPRADTGWAEEMSLDLDMVSAACPLCHILLVEADQPSIASLGEGVDTAVRLGVKYISNSYGGPEEVTRSAADFGHFDHPGVAITAASGDGGYGVLFPATSPRVTAVGGTSLLRAANARGWNETAWSGAGSGCSVHAVKPAWQKDTGCPRRTVADVSAVADPRTGVAVYDTFGFGGWQVVGGTSASAPIIAGAYALAGALPAGYAAAVPYTRPAKLNDVVQGSTGMCTPAYLCTAGPGYDGPTGLGTPSGVAAFASSTPSGQRARQAGAARPDVTGPGRRARAMTPVTNPRPATAGRTPSAPTGIRNGGFEAGNLSGWASSGVLTGVTKDKPHSGKYAALLGDPEDPHRGDSSIKQSFTAARGHRRLSFWYNVNCLDREKLDWATASLRDDTSGSTQTVLPRTCTFDNTWQQVTAPVIGGHAYTLTLVSHDDGYFGDPASTKYDDVTLS